MNKMRALICWKRLLLCLILGAVLSASAFGYWISQVRASWDISLKHSAVIWVTGLTPLPEEAADPETQLEPDTDTSGDWMGDGEAEPTPEPVIEQEHHADR